MQTDESFDEVIMRLPERLNRVLRFVPYEIKCNIFEIRLRKNRPIVLFGKNGTVFVDDNSITSLFNYENGLIVTESDIAHTISSVCDYSIYSHQNDISNGFVSFGAGHRVGFCGTAVKVNGKTETLKDISSLNMRIARRKNGCADAVLHDTFLKECTVPSLIFAGPPCTGKTTVLKDFARQISSKVEYGFKKTIIIDERFEMSDINGINCDILSGYSKSDGIIHAVRTLSPDFIICDEIAFVTEAEQIISLMNTGIKFAVSIHCCGIEDLLKRQAGKTLVYDGSFDYAVFFNDRSNPGKIENIIKTEDLKNENDIRIRHNIKHIDFGSNENKT